MRNINSSPDLGIESDQGRFSSLEATSSGIQIDTPKVVSTVEICGSSLDPNLSAVVINSGECIICIMQRMQFHSSYCVLGFDVSTEPSSVSIVCQVYFVVCYTEGWEWVVCAPVTILDCQTNTPSSPAHACTHTNRPFCYLQYVLRWPKTHKFPLPVYTVKCMLNRTCA